MVAPNRGWQKTVEIVDTTELELAAAAGVGIQNYLTNLQYQNKDATIATVIQVKAGSVVIWQANAPAAMTAPVAIKFDQPLKSGPNTAFNADCVTTSSETIFNAQGFVGQ